MLCQEKDIPTLFMTESVQPFWTTTGKKYYKMSRFWIDEIISCQKVSKITALYELCFRNVCYSKENEVVSHRNPWLETEESGRAKNNGINKMNFGSSKFDFHSSCPSFKSFPSNLSLNRRKLNRTWIVMLAICVV